MLVKVTEQGGVNLQAVDQLRRSLLATPASVAVLTDGMVSVGLCTVDGEVKLMHPNGYAPTLSCLPAAAAAAAAAFLQAAKQNLA